MCAHHLHGYRRRVSSGLYQAVRAVGQGGVSPISLILWLVLSVFIVAGVVMVQRIEHSGPVRPAWLAGA